MKRIFLAIAFVAMFFSAKAWTSLVDNASYIIARKYMSKQALAEYNRLTALRQTVDYKWVADDAARATLDADLRSTTTDEKDVVVRLEKAVEVLRNRKNESDSLVQASLRTAIQLVGDIHNLSNIHIEGNETTKGFDFTLYAVTKGSSAGEKMTKRKSSWRALWHNYTNRHDVFSPHYYAADIELSLANKKAEYEKGTPRFWAENVGEDVVRCLEVIYPNALIKTEIEHRYEDINDKCMAKAGYRLAALLNEIFN